MNAVVVLPSRIRTEPVRTRVATLVVCAEMTRANTLQTELDSLGSQTAVLSTGAQVRDFAGRNAPPDTCVIVTPLPDGPVLPLIRLLRSRGWSKVVVLSGRADARAVHAALTSGVRSVIVRGDSQAALRAPLPQTGQARLSEREREVLRMVADGQTNRAVGERLGLSGLTVKSHLARIARKLGCGDRAQMVATAIRSGYIR